MAGWSKIADGSCLKTPAELQCFDLELGIEGFVKGTQQGNLRCIFDDFLSDFLLEICGSRCLRPLPPMLGNGHSVDLFKLYLVVREKGGHERVSKNGQWELVAKESGLDSGIAPGLKLVYIKYLDTLDKWLQRIVQDKDSKGRMEDSVRDCSVISEIKGFLSEISNQKVKDGVEELLIDVENSEVRSFVESGGVEENANEKASDGGDKDDMVMKSTVVGKEDERCRKRKRECFSEMLKWIIGVAKDPCDRAIGSLPERSKWKSYGSEQIWKRVIWVRKAMLSKRNVDSSAEQSIWQKKQKMHPTMYDDHTGSERSRCSQRLIFAKESRALPSSKKSKAQAGSEASSTATESDLEDTDPLTADSAVGLWGNKRRGKRIPVGSCHQAEVPEWTGEINGSDPKWLGTQVWPLEKRVQGSHLIERERMGKGRQDSCGCQFPGSLECVRFHVAEKRKRVKLELCSAFHQWKFDKMGEEVALSWTREEEKQFRAIVRSNPPSLGKCFWDGLSKCFLTKSRGDLVSYYFNVFLLQRRADQNRSTSSNINSDDEAIEFGLSTNGVGQGAVKSSGSIFCSPKKHLNFDRT
ncbi:hypothetical protein RJ640_023934 [Escallonia rubra]|uniref:ARID domain-containing protein n=1 Tax=Escallonia rubra TaxID=112253 RepID=A0AA88UPG9_9ASTE|nr:hypothetical protein RJ640_023934 [Escallonia rubra]